MPFTHRRCEFNSGTKVISIISFLSRMLSYQYYKNCRYQYISNYDQINRIHLTTFFLGIAAPIILNFFPVSCSLIILAIRCLKSSMLVEAARNLTFFAPRSAASALCLYVFRIHQLTLFFTLHNRNLALINPSPLCYYK